MPVGAYGGKKEIMSNIAPLGKVYQAGTLSGNPIAMRAGFTLLSILNQSNNHFDSLDQKTQYLHEGLNNVLASFNKPFVINRFGSMISIHFSENPVVDFESASQSDNAFFNQFFHKMLTKGVYLPPSAFESWFLNDALSYNDLDVTIQAAKESMAELLN
jgi:glutamate-1-semialdehyde 2,1-aminomutase